MRKFLDILASGARSLSFKPTMEMPSFERKGYERRVKLRTPHSPAEIMREAWEDVGIRMREAIGEAEREYGRVGLEL